MDFKVGDLVIATHSSTPGFECSYAAGKVYTVVGLDITNKRITTIGPRRELNSWSCGKFIKLPELSELEKVIYNVID